MLIEGIASKFDPAKYEDSYTEEVQMLKRLMILS
jgi:non-homologous end joining protein Ku